MIVVADSGPLHYLILLEHVDLLRRFYGQVLVPEPVASELSAAEAPSVVREWIMKPPAWVDVRAEPLPRNPNGKIDRTLLAADLAHVFADLRC